MKRILVFAILCLLFTSAGAQQFRFGLKGAYNSTWLFNNNTSDKGDDLDNASAFGGSFGLTTRFHFSEEAGVSVDILSTTHNAKFEGKDLLGLTFTATDRLKYLDIPVLFHLGQSDGGGYVEIGPQFSFLTGAEEDYASEAPGSYTGRDVERDFNGTDIAAVLGFGYDFYLADNLYLDAGLRFVYGLTDATKEFSEPEFDSSNRSVASSSAHEDAKGAFNYEASHRAYGGLNLALTYTMGRASRHRN